MVMSLTVALSTRSTVRACGQLIILLVVILAVGKVTLHPSLRILMGHVPVYGAIIAYGFHLFVACSVLYLFSCSPDRVYAFAQGLSLAFSPFVIISTTQLVVWLAFSPGLSSGARSLDPQTPERRGNDRRVVWLLFDELDASVAFSPGAPVALPEFDKLKNEGFSHLGVQPSSFKTLTAIPELTIGRRVSVAVPADPNTLILTTGDASESWSSTQTIFDWASGRGLRVGVVGFYHPYCRVFPDVLSACIVEPMERGAFATGSNVVKSATPRSESVALRLLQEWQIARARVLMLASPNSDDTREIEIPRRRRAQLRAFRKLRDAALEYSADPRLDFVFLHMPIPHPLGIYDRDSGDYSLDRSRNYIDNLVLVDKTLGEIRASIQEASLDQRTVLVVGSDHPMREFWREFSFWTEEMERIFSARKSETIPLFVVTPEAQPARYEGPLGALVVYDLLKLLINGGSPEAADWSNWMSTRYPDLKTKDTVGLSAN